MDNELELQDSLQPDYTTLGEELQEQEDETNSNLELIEKNKQLFERAKKAELEAKELKRKLESQKQEVKPEEKNLQTNNPSITEAQVEEKIFMSQGGSQEELELLRSIRDVKKVSLFEAKNDTLFVLYKQQKDKEEKEKEATLSASNARAKEKEKSKPLSSEEHKAQTMKASQELLRKKFG